MSTDTDQAHMVPHLRAGLFLRGGVDDAVQATVVRMTHLWQGRLNPRNEILYQLHDLIYGEREP